MQQSKDRAVRWAELDLIGSEMEWTKLKKEEGKGQTRHTTGRNP